MPHPYLHPDHVQVILAQVRSFYVYNYNILVIFYAYSFAIAFSSFPSASLLQPLKHCTQ